jgi:hypothetical protein
MIGLEEIKRSVVILGEAHVGKTHYGAQLLKRLIVGDCSLTITKNGATNLEPFEAAMASLAEGITAAHTATATYVESVWPITDRNGQEVDLVWPDYGGEQLSNLFKFRKVPRQWRERVGAASDWILLIRLQTMHQNQDVFSHPISSLGQPQPQNDPIRGSDQARMIELLQMLLYVAGFNRDALLSKPTLLILLTCWDEIGSEAVPQDLLKEQLPMLAEFINSTWRKPTTFGLSALGRALSPSQPDMDYTTRGPERFGYVMLPDGGSSQDITLPLKHLLAGARR